MSFLHTCFARIERHRVLVEATLDHEASERELVAMIARQYRTEACRVSIENLKRVRWS